MVILLWMQSISLKATDSKDVSISMVILILSECRLDKA